MANKYDLRYAIEILKKYNDQIIKTKDEVDPHGQLAEYIDTLELLALLNVLLK